MLVKLTLGLYSYVAIAFFNVFQISVCYKDDDKVTMRDVAIIKMADTPVWIRPELFMVR